MTAPLDSTILAQIAAKLSADDARAILQQTLADEAEEVSFWDYDDLVCMGIVKSRTGLFHLQRDWGFPRSAPLGGRRSGFHRPAVKRWVEAQLAKPTPLPGTRRPPNRYPHQPVSASPRRRVGRPRKNPPPEEAAMQ